jgi:hypothetical protein
MAPPLNEEQQAILDNLWYDRNIKVGIRKFYEYLKTIDGWDMFGDISYRQCSDYLKNQQDYQMNQYVKKIKHLRVIKASMPYEFLSMDLMDYSQGVPQNGSKYILQIIDVHTRSLTSYPLYNKKCFTIRDKFQQFLNEVIEPSGFEVQSIQTDAGGEFNGIEMRQFFEERQIIHINSTMPQNTRNCRTSKQKYWRIVRKIGSSK